MCRPLFRDFGTIGIPPHRNLYMWQMLINFAIVVFCGYPAGMGTQTPHAGPQNSFVNSFGNSIIDFVHCMVGDAICQFGWLLIYRTARPTDWYIDQSVTSRRYSSSHEIQLDPIPHAGAVLSAAPRTFGRCFKCANTSIPWHWMPSVNLFPHGPFHSGWGCGISICLNVDNYLPHA